MPIDDGSFDGSDNVPDETTETRDKLKKLLAPIKHRLASSEVAAADVPWLFWCIFLDAAAMFHDLTGQAPTHVFIPEAMATVLQRYANSQSSQPINVREKLLGCPVSTNTARLLFK